MRICERSRDSPMRVMWRRTQLKGRARAHRRGAKSMTRTTRSKLVGHRRAGDMHIGPRSCGRAHPPDAMPIPWPSVTIGPTLPCPGIPVPSSFSGSARLGVSPICPGVHPGGLYATSPARPDGSDQVLFPSPPPARTLHIAPNLAFLQSLPGLASALPPLLPARLASRHMRPGLGCDGRRSMLLGARARPSARHLRPSSYVCLGGGVSEACSLGLVDVSAIRLI